MIPDRDIWHVGAHSVHNLAQKAIEPQWLSQPVNI